MSVNSSDFERFLYANYPDDYRRATASNVPEDVLTAIVSRHNSHYLVWKNIPEWVKNRYQDRLPKEVLNGNETVKDFVKKEELQVHKEEKETIELVDFSVSLLAMGYAAETVKTMAENRMKREQLLRAAPNGELTEEQKSLWQALRQSDCEVIARDWQQNQPEKYLFHLIKEMNRSQKRGEKVNTQTMNELENMLPLFTDKANRKKMVEYLRQKPQQAALSHLSPEVLGKFSGILKDCGINIAPAKANGAGMEISRDSLVASLKKHFQWRVKMEEMLKEQYAQRNVEFSSVSVRDVLNDGLKKLAPFRSKDKQQRV
ncbi:MAG: hypothetical protein NC218_05605 [Acetobacter sp.]|nr:hypothetical protein [Acetobacter sp.]